MEEQREADRLAILFGDHRLRRAFLEQGVRQPRLGRRHGVRLALERGQVAHEAEDQGGVTGRGGADRQDQIAASTLTTDRRRAAIRQPVMISAAPASV